MEEYLQYMRTLRSQMNDVEDQVAKVSAEEQTQTTTARTLENDLNSVRSQMKQIKEDTDLMIKAKGQICSQILEKQKRIASLESDIATLTQTLELIQQERVGLSAKLADKRNYYAKVADDFVSNLQQQKDWVTSRITNERVMDGELGDDGRKNLRAQLDTAKAKLSDIEEMKFRLVAENNKVKQSIEQVKCEARSFKPELLPMEIEALEAEYKALLADKDGEFEFLQSLQDQIQKLKGISHKIKCPCGVEYQVVMEFCT